MLDAVDLGKLVAYKRIMSEYFEQHGSRIWALLYQTDVRTRAELFVRIKRQGLADYNKALDEAIDWYNDEAKARSKLKHAFDPARPWDYVFGEVMNEQTQSTWWFKQVDLPILHDEKKRSVNEHVDGDAKVDGANGKRGLDGGTGKERPTKKPKTGAKANERVHNVVNGHHQTTRSNKALCKGFNQGWCWRANGIHCQANPGEVHLCSKCLDPGHNATQCNKSPHTPSWAARQQQDAGRGRGRGRSGKGGGKGWSQH